MALVTGSSTVSHAAERPTSDLGDPALLPAPPADALGYPSRAADLDARPGFRQPPAGYGEVPFWWWTGDALDRDRLLWQIEELHEKGITGVQVNYAHRDTKGWPTYPVTPEVFSPEWWKIWGFVAKECGKRDMGIGLSGYTLDWPNGKSLVSRTIYSDPEIQGRELKVTSKVRAKGGETATVTLPDDTVAVRAYRVAEGRVQTGAVDVLPHDRVRSSHFSGSGARGGRPAKAGTTCSGVDGVRDGALAWTAPEGEWEVWCYSAPRKAGTLNPAHPLAGRRVIEGFFDRFVAESPDKSAKGLNYFFHDELKFGVGDRVWADDLPEQFRARKGYDLFDALPAMFGDIGPRTVKARLDFMDVKMQLVQERYFCPIFEWQWRHGLIYGCDQGSRGRKPMEFGDYFSCVKWYTAPGHDTPGGKADLIKGKVSSSIAHFYKRPRVWLEGYHSLGWGAAPELLMHATRQNFLYGCTLLNLHGLYYTTHGSYWEWAPPCYHFRMPYWEHMPVFLKYFERLSYLLSQGVHQCDVAVLYPVSPGQAQLGGDAARDEAFDAGTKLYNGGRDFVFIDDDSVARARVEAGGMHVVDTSYRVLVLPAMRAIRWRTLLQAQALFRAGGMVLATGALPEASDHAGSDDPELDAVVKELFGATAAEANAGAKPAVQRNAAGGVGAFLVPQAGPSEKSYPDGAVGPWVWTPKASSTAFMKGICPDTLGKGAGCRIRFHCDNSGALWLNGRRLCSGATWNRGWTGSVELRAGDVLTVEGQDNEAPGGQTAGVFLAVLHDGKTVMNAADFRCTTQFPDGDDWHTSTAMTGLAIPNQAYVHPAHRGVNDSCWGAGLELMRTIPLDVASDANVHALHRRVGPRDVYMVMGAPKGEECSFRAQGRAELWDPWTGETRPLHVTSRDGERTRVRMPLEAYEAQIVVFSPGEPASSIASTDLDEVTGVRVTNGSPAVTGFSDKAGERHAIVQLDGQEVRVSGAALEPSAPRPLDGDWEFELQPTMNNRWGDFRLPIDETMIGPEARIFRYADAECVDGNACSKAAFDDRDWQTVTYGFGPKLWKLGPIPDGVDVDALDAALCSAAPGTIDREVGMQGHVWHWEPYAFSWRRGVEGDSGHQGYHGLKENVTDHFICLGKPTKGLNEIVYAPEEAGRHYYLRTSVFAESATSAKLLVGGLEPAAVFVNGEKVADVAGPIALRPGGNAVLLRYDGAGRGYAVLEKTDSTVPRERTPLAMQWYDRPGILPFDTRPEEATPVGWYRFTSPPGFRGMTVTVRGDVEAWADGVPMRVEGAAVGKADGSRVVTLRAATPASGPVAVALKVRQDRGCYAGSAFPVPIKLDCGPGQFPAGDWSRNDCLACYSGGAWYRRTFALSEEDCRGRVTLDLGAVAATAEVKVNGVSVATRVAPPWTVDITSAARPGTNRVEILVFNTLANHYRTIPTLYRGNPVSGLLGPVALRVEHPVTLTVPGR